MKQITTNDDVKQLGSILCAWAHPDDETFNCGGLLAAAVQNGQAVACLTATKGEAGVQDESRWPAVQLGEIRTRELGEALHILGVHHQHWLGYKDGECQSVSDEEGKNRILEFIELYRPDSILTFGPDGMTGHPDHKAVSKWAIAAAGEIVPVYYAVEDQDIYETYLAEADRQFNFFFNIDKPPLKPAADCAIAFKLSPELCRTKEKALRAMPSQYEKFFQGIPDDFISAAFGLECFVRAKS